MDKPRIADAPGLGWRPRRNAWAAIWLATKKGFKPATRQIMVFDHQPTVAEAIEVRKACIAFQEEMYGEKPAKETGTVRALINAYQTDPDSPYHTARYQSRRGFDFHLRHIDAAHGAVKLADLGARDFKRWYRDRRGENKVSSAHAMITTVRLILRFGAAFEIDEHCGRLKAILSDMTFEKGKARTEAMTVRQCEDVIAAATKPTTNITENITDVTFFTHERGIEKLRAETFPSIALAQALQFELCLRQKDVIGEWVPLAEPGISTVTWHGRKWLRGLRWEEISSTMILNHAMSKSRTGKMLEFDLKLYPMVMAELAKIPQEKRTGPVIVCELTKRPWVQNHFRDKWRGVARKAGVPDAVKNMDSRAGGTTETIEATGGNMEAARKQAGHSDSRTTVRYSRGDLKSNSEVAVLRANSRTKEK